jgi:integrase
LYRLGVPDNVIQRILRHSNVSTTLSYYVKSKPQDAQDAMTKLEKAMPENSGLPDTPRGHPAEI